MIPPSLPGAAESLVALPANSSSPSDFPEIGPDEGDAFSSFISQALDSSSANPVALNQESSRPTADVDSSSDDLNSSSVQWSNADATQSSTPADSGDDQAHGASGPKQSNGTIDPTVANNLAAFLAGLMFPMSNPERFVPTFTISKGGTNGYAATASISDNTARVSTTTPQAVSQSASQVAGSINKSLAGASANLATGLKPVNEAASGAKDSASSAPVAPVPAANAADSAKEAAQATALQASASIGKEGNPLIKDGGTTAALNVQTMKFTGQKNENAGSTVQKLPSAASNGGPSAGSGNSSGAQLGTTGSGRKTDWTGLPATFDLTIPTAGAELHDGPSSTASTAADNSTAQVERITNLVAQEALTVKLSGATSLAVSLKLDPQTELFVQLTNHNGQIQASLRCERGSLAGLDGHWGQLQESLARQNIQLLPPDNQTFTRGQGGNYSDAAGSRNSEQSSQNDRQPASSQNAQTASPAPAVNTASPSKGKTKRPGSKGWESWA